LCHFPHNKWDDKEGGCQGSGLTLITIWEAFNLDFNRNVKKDDLRELYRVLEVTTDESKLQIPCNCDVKLRRLATVFWALECIF